MATWGHGLGVARENVSGNSRLICGGSAFPGGTVTDIKLHCAGFAGGGNIRCWVFSDTNSDPSGATLIYDSGNLSLNITQIPATYGDRSFVTDFGQTVNFALAAGPVYIAVGAQDHAFGLGNSGQGANLDYLSSRDQNVSALLTISQTINTPNPFPTYSSGGQAEQIMVQLVYTAGGGGSSIFPPVARGRQIGFYPGRQ